MPKSMQSFFGVKTKTNKPRRRLTPSQQKTIILDSKSKCSYCKKKFDPLTLDVHHIKPFSKGGTNKPTNLAVLCAGCHRRVHKGLITTKDLKPIRKSRKRKVTKKPSAKKRKRKTPLERHSEKWEKFFS